MSDPRTAILALGDDTATKPVKGFPGAFVRKISIAEMDVIAGSDKESGLHLLRFALCNKEGEPLFTEDDLPALRKLKIEPFRDLTRQVSDFNRIEAQASEKTLKN